MRRTSLLTATVLALAAPAASKTFVDAPILESEGVNALNRTVARQQVARDLFGAPYATAVVGHVDVYEGFPYLESRWFQVVSDPEWNRLLAGEIGGSLTAHDGQETSFGALETPRGLSTDEYGRIWVADTGNHRVLAFGTSTEFDRIDLVPLFAIEGLARPYDVAYSDGGTPFQASDDRVYVADTGNNRVVAYDVSANGARQAFAMGQLGSGPGRFAGPLAISVGRSDGAATGDVYVADSHSGQIVHLADRGDRFDWIQTAAHDKGPVTSLDVDHWGAVYAASPAAGSVTKYSSELVAVAGLDAPAARPRAFHVPFVNRTDHRDGSVRRVGQGSGLLVEEWTDVSGIRLVKLGVEVKDLRLESDSGIAADFVTTDRAAVAAEIVHTSSGRVVFSKDLGALGAGAHRVSFSPAELTEVPSGEQTLRVRAASTYPGVDADRSEASFEWTGALGAAPGALSLRAIDPNPFRGSTAIEFAVPAGSEHAFGLRVYDVSGRLVRTVDSGVAAPGVHVRTWDGRDEAGRSVAAGVYLVRLVLGQESATRKTVLLR